MFSNFKNYLGCNIIRKLVLLLGDNRKLDPACLFFHLNWSFYFEIWHSLVQKMWLLCFVQTRGVHEVLRWLHEVSCAGRPAQSGHGKTPKPHQCAEPVQAERNRGTFNSIWLPQTYLSGIWAVMCCFCRWVKHTVHLKVTVCVRWSWLPAAADTTSADRFKEGFRSCLS